MAEQMSIRRCRGTDPSILLAFKIAGYFGMSIEEIFIYEEEGKG